MNGEYSACLLQGRSFIVVGRNGDTGGLGREGRWTWINPQHRFIKGSGSGSWLQSTARCKLHWSPQRRIRAQPRLASVLPQPLACYLVPAAPATGHLERFYFKFERLWRRAYARNSVFARLALETPHPLFPRLGERNRGIGSANALAQVQERVRIVIELEL